MCVLTMMFRLAFSLLLPVLLSSPVHAEPAFSLPQLEEMALLSNRHLAASRDQLEVARAAIESAAALPNPEVEWLSGQQRPRGVGSTSGASSSVSVTQPLDLPWKRAPRIAVAEANLHVSEAGARMFKAEVLAQLRGRYFETLRRSAELRNAQEDQALMEKVHQRIALRVETGEAPRFELIKADAEMRNAQKSAQAAAFRLEQARSQLRQVVGAALPAQFALQGRLRDVPMLRPLAEVRGQGQANNPELARARADLVQAERQLALEQAQRLPDLALKVAAEQDPEMRHQQLGVVLRIPLWDQRRGPVAEAVAQVSRARNTLEGQAFVLGQSLEVAYQQYEIAQTQVTALESGIVRQAEAALKIAEAAYKFGERGFLEVLDAQRVFRAARAELIAARYELATAWVDIERLLAIPEGKLE